MTFLTDTNTQNRTLPFSRGQFTATLPFVVYFILAASLCLSPLTAKAQFNPMSLTGTVTHAITGNPVVNARVMVSRRFLELLPDGTASLKSMDQVQPVASITSDMNGIFRLNLLSAETSEYYSIGVTAPGYLEQMMTLARIESGKDAVVNFDLVPDPLSGEEMERLNRKHALHKLSLYGLNPSFEQEAEPAELQSESRGPGGPRSDRFEQIPGPEEVQSRPRMQALKGQAEDNLPARYPVPEQVFVNQLPDSGFTGLMDFDELVAGTVSAEMGDGFPLEALKAQAVAARTYALDRLNRRGYANGGQAYTATIGRKSLTAAVHSSGLVLLYLGNVITAYFSARCNGDFTLNSEEGPTLSNCQTGGLGAGIVPWARARPCSGHANCSETGERCCAVMVQGRTNYIYGHGVGLCQRGAQQFAGRDGWGWDQILTHYYTGIALANLPGLAAGDSVMTTAKVNIRNGPCGGTVMTTMATNLLGVILGGPQRPICTLASPYSYLTWWEVLFDDGTRGWAAEDYLRKTVSHLPVAVTLGWRHSQTNLVLFWPTHPPNWKLQSAEALSLPDSWSDTTNLPVILDGHYQVTLEAPSENRFYRLRSP